MPSMDTAQAHAAAAAQAAQAAEARQATFQQLRPICSVLLQHRTSPAQLTQRLTALSAALASAHPQGLSSCWDYVLFPLTLIIDSISPLRQAPAPAKPSAATSPGPAPEDEPQVPVPAAKSDQVAEAALGCLLAMLERCAAVERDQVLELLQRLMPLLKLSAGATASEELIALVFKCIGAAFTLLASGSQPPGSLAFTPSTSPAPPDSAEAEAVPFLPMAGYMIHTCLNVATTQLNAGASGSRDVRLASLNAMAAVVRSLTSPDNAAFFLPGIVSGLSRQLLPPGSASSWSGGGGGGGTSAGGASSCLVAALRCLTDAVTRSLGDDEALLLLRAAAPRPAEPQPPAAASASVASALSQLRTMSMAVTAGGGVAPPAAGPQPAQQGSLLPAAAGPPGAAAGPPSLSVRRSAAWVQESGARVGGLLAQVLPPLCEHPRPGVRGAAAAAAVQLLRRCGAALGPSGSRLLMDAVLTLAQDEWQQVSAPCIELISSSGTAEGRGALGTTAGPSWAPAGPSWTPAGAATAGDVNPGSSSSSSALTALLEELAGGLFAGVRAGEVKGISAARRLTSAMLMAGPVLTCQVLVERAAVLAQLLAVLTKCLAFDPASTLLLLHAKHGAGLYLASSAITPAPSPAQPHPSPPSPSASDQPAPPPPPPSTSSQRPLLSAPQLPHMPLGLLYATSTRSYEAVAGVAQCLAHQARLADALTASSTGSAGSNLRRVVDQVVTQLHESGGPQGELDQVQGGGHQHNVAVTDAARPWQLPAASSVVLASELLFGASGLWRPPFAVGADAGAAAAASGGGTAAVAGARGAADVGASDAAYEAMAMQVLQELLRPGLWGVATSAEQLGEQPPPPPPPPSPQAPGQPPSSAAQEKRASAQVIACNALLARCLLEAVGAAARCLGPRFSSRGRPLRAALLPLLERLADPLDCVRAAAAGALACLCLHCGYPGGLGELLGRNADYVVDGMCSQLRDLGRHPRAPQLLAAMLGQAGVVPELLPLMSEPLRAALQGLSILSRRQQLPHTVYCFLRVLHHVALGVSSEASALAAQTDAAVGSVRAQVEALQRIKEQQQQGGQQGGQQQGGQQQEGQQQGVVCQGAEKERPAGAGSSAQRGEGAKEFFLDRLRSKQQEAGVSGVDLSEGAGGPGQGAEEGVGAGGPGGFTMSALERAEAEERLRRVHAAAVLAAAAADASTPLLTAPVLRDCISALDTCQTSLQGLQACTRSLETDLQLLEEVGGKLENAVSPVRPETPRLLPAIAAAWPSLLCALRDPRTPAVVRAVSLLAETVRLAGAAFMSSRLRQQAMPLLLQLLQHGTAAAPEAAGGAALTGGGPGGRGGPALAPAAVQAVRVAVLECFAALSHGAGGSTALQRLAWDIGSAALPLLGKAQPAAVRAAATAALLGAAWLDADATWILLYDAVGDGRRAGGRACEVEGVGKLAAWKGPGRLRAGKAAHGSWPVTAALCDECGAAASELLSAVEGMQAAWHERAPVIAPDWSTPDDDVEDIAGLA